MRVAQDRREPAPPFALSLPRPPPFLSHAASLSDFAVREPVEGRGTDERASAIVRRARRAGHQVGGIASGRVEGTRGVGSGGRREGGGKGERRRAVSKETRTPGGKNGSARVRKEERKVEGF